MKRKLLSLVLVCLIAMVLASCKKEEAQETETPDTGFRAEQTDKPQTEDQTEPVTEDPQIERDALEATRKEEYGEFYVPLPALGEEREKTNVLAKGIFIGTSISGESIDEDNVKAYESYILKGTAEPDVNTLESLLATVNATELNAIVVDIKSDEGYVTYESEIEEVKRIDSTLPQTTDRFQALAAFCEANDIHLIGRLVTFKDQYFAEQEPDHAIQLAEGGVYRDGAGAAWVNPFDDFVWNYVVSIAKEAANLGFDEIQFDYVRFPDGAATYNPITYFPGREERDKDEAIEDFLAFAKEELEPYNVTISADVFGIITHTWDDSPEDIGQTWRKISNQVDVICPMVYPSHYSEGWYGYQYPDQHPYGVLYQSMQEAIERNAAITEPAAIRPWIQGFTASWVDGYIDYDAATIAEQIVACRDPGE